jgi:hypothetical protein
MAFISTGAEYIILYSALVGWLIFNRYQNGREAEVVLEVFVLSSPKAHGQVPRNEWSKIPSTPYTISCTSSLNMLIISLTLTFHLKIYFKSFLDLYCTEN